MDSCMEMCTLTVGAYMIGGVDIALKIITELILYISTIEINKPDSDVQLTAKEKFLINEMLIFLLIIYTLLLVPPVLLIVGAWKRIPWCIMAWMLITVFTTFAAFFANVPVTIAVFMCTLKFFSILCMWQLYREIKMERRQKVIV